MASCAIAMKQQGPRLGCLRSERLPHALVASRAGEGVGEGRAEEGGGVRGCEESRRST
jgi:hypothetical protein